MDYERALAFWHSRINFEERTPLRGEFKLDRMQALLDLLGNPQHRLRIIHVAGSKGKGSTCAMLASILQQARYRTGLFTSPHLGQVDERVQVDGQRISRDELTFLLNEIRFVLESPEGRQIRPTFFEIATALGFLHFARRQVDAAVQQLRHVDWRISRAAVAAGLAGVCWPARIEVVGSRPLVVLDCAHNVASVEALVTTLHESFPPGRRLLVFACSRDNDVAGMVRALRGHFAHAFLTRYANNPRAVPVEELARVFAQENLPFTASPAAWQAWNMARAAARPEDLICVTGSVFLAGDLRPVLLHDSMSGEASHVGRQPEPLAVV